MDSAILSLLGAFLLSIMGLFVFIWSMRKGLLVENPRAASVIFAHGEGVNGANSLLGSFPFLCPTPIRLTH